MITLTQAALDDATGGPLTGARAARELTRAAAAPGDAEGSGGDGAGVGSGSGGVTWQRRLHVGPARAALLAELESTAPAGARARGLACAQSHGRTGARRRRRASRTAGVSGGDGGGGETLCPCCIGVVLPGRAVSLAELGGADATGTRDRTRLARRLAWGAGARSRIRVR